VVTQGEGARGSLASALAAKGAEVVPLPAIAIEPPKDVSPLDAALSALADFDWIVFTSRHAVEAVCARPAWTASRETPLPALRVAAVGRATAQCLVEHGVTTDVFPSEAGGRALAEAIASAGVARAGASAPPRASNPHEAPAPSTAASAASAASAPSADGAEAVLAGVRILWPRSEIALRELPDALRKTGATIVEPVAYRTVVPDDGAATVATVLASLEQGSIDAVAFLSPSSAKNLPALLGRPDLSWLARRAAVASIGPSTSAALRELGAPPAVESSERTAEDLAATLVSWLASHPQTSRRSAS
jgi:uroporphyrinogen-III synthase